MKRFFEILHGARKLEWILLMLLLVLLVAILLEAPLQSGSDIERRLQDILGRIDGAGKVEVLIAENADGAPEGVLVVTDGAEDIAVNIRLQQAVHTLLGLDISRIEVVQRTDPRR